MAGEGHNFNDCELLMKANVMAGRLTRDYLVSDEGRDYTRVPHGSMCDEGLMGVKWCPTAPIILWMTMTMMMMLNPWFFSMRFHDERHTHIFQYTSLRFIIYKNIIILFTQKTIHSGGLYTKG